MIFIGANRGVEKNEAITTLVTLFGTNRVVEKHEIFTAPVTCNGANGELGNTNPLLLLCLSLV